MIHELYEIEHHLHNYEHWFEKATTPTATHFADHIGVGNGAFQIDAGNNTWGAWVHILGSSDTPFVPKMRYYDFHRLEISATERAFPYFIQIGWGVDAATALANYTYSSVVFCPTGATGEQSPLMIMCEHNATGTNCFARCNCPGQNTGTLDFYFGIHEYGA